MSEPTSSAGDIASIRYHQQSGTLPTPPAGYSRSYFDGSGVPRHMGPDGVAHGYGPTALAALTTDVDTTGHARGHYLEYDPLTSKYTDVPGPTVNGQAAGILPGNSASANTTALATLLATGASVYLPAGSYPITATTGALFNLTATGQQIVGDGPGRTILQFASGVALTGQVYVVQLSGLWQQVRDLSILNGSGQSGSGDWTGINIAQGAFWPRVQRVEVADGWGSATNAGGIGSYQGWLAPEFSTTLGTTIVPGTRTVTPGNVRGIQPGRSLHIADGSPEDVTVTAIDLSAGTFTAVFAHGHASTAPVQAYSWGNQWVWIEDCLIRDFRAGSGLQITSNYAVIRNTVVRNCGHNTQDHGAYVEAGGLLLDGCYFEGNSGYNLHFHMQAPNLDSSMNRIVNCVSVNPGAGHFVIDTTPADGSNPQLPNGTPGGRQFLMQGCVFRKTPALVSTGLEIGVVINGVPGVISNCLFEDTCTGTWLDASATPHCVIAGNHFNALNAAGTMIQAGTANVISGNVFTFPQGNGIGVATDDVIIQGNTLASGGAGALALSLAGSNIKVLGNQIVTQNTCLQLADTVRDVEIAGNSFKNNAGVYQTALSIDGGTPHVTGSIHDNHFIQGFLGISAATANVTIYDNDGPIGYTATLYIPTTREMGMLLPFPFNGSLAAGVLARLDSSGTLVPLTTSDTEFAAINLTYNFGATGETVFAGRPGTAARGVLTDGAWTAGHYGVPSGTDAGKLHDTGSSTRPGSGSYVLFLDSGGGAGSARVWVARTQLTA